MTSAERSLRNEYHEIIVQLDRMATGWLDGYTNDSHVSTGYRNRSYLKAKRELCKYPPFMKLIAQERKMNRYFERLAKKKRQGII